VTETGNQKKGTMIGTAIGTSGSEIPEIETSEKETVGTIITTIASHPTETLANETPEIYGILVIPITVAESGTSETRVIETSGILETFEMHAIFEKGISGICETHGMCGT
jgi:hypothetical protein